MADEFPERGTTLGASRTAEGELPGVSAIRYELIGSTTPEASGFVHVTAGVGDNPNSRPSFLYDLSTMTETVRYFKIRRVYTFANQ